MSLTSRDGGRCEQEYRAGSFIVFKVCVLALRIETEQRAPREVSCPNSDMLCFLDRALPILNLSFPMDPQNSLITPSPISYSRPKYQSLVIQSLNFSEQILVPFLNLRQTKPLDVSSCDG